MDCLLSAIAPRWIWAGGSGRVIRPPAEGRFRCSARSSIRCAGRYYLSRVAVSQGFLYKSAAMVEASIPADPMPSNSLLFLEFSRRIARALAINQGY
jgi:hypothetical protein